MSATLLLVSSGVGLASESGRSADAAPVVSTITLAPVADTYVTSAAPGHVWGTTNQIQAGDQPGHHKAGYVNFRVPAFGGQTIATAKLVLVRTNHHLGSVVQARRVTATSLNERTVTAKSAPSMGTVLSSVSTSAASSSVTLDVTKVVLPGASVTIGITTTSTKDFVAFRSREWGQGAPELVLTVRRSDAGVPPVSPTSGVGTTSSRPTASVAPSTSSAPTASSSPTAKPTDKSSAPPPTAPKPSTTPAPPPSTTSPPLGSCVTNAMGIPSSGAYVGAAVSGKPDLPGLEQQIGRPIAIHRTYFEAGQVDAAIASVKADIAAGRLPWISFKMPYSWADMAAGKGDAWTIDLADRLATVGGPVWLAFHHEPEGDGNIQDWVRMQQHLSPIIHAHTNNVAYTVIYTGYDALFGPSQYRLDQVWPGDQYVDVAGFDVYNDYASNRNGDANIPMLDPMKYFGVIGPWARQHHVAWGVAETGLTAPAAQKDSTWLQTELSDLESEGGSALTYFDSTLNSITDWSLSDSTRMNAFASIAKQTDRVC